MAFFLCIAGVSQPKSTLLYMLLLHKAKEKVCKSHLKVESTHTEPSTLLIISVPAPGRAMGRREETFLPSPAHITEISKIWGGLFIISR